MRRCRCPSPPGACRAGCSTARCARRRAAAGAEVRCAAVLGAEADGLVLAAAARRGWGGPRRARGARHRQARAARPSAARGAGGRARAEAASARARRRNRRRCCCPSTAAMRACSRCPAAPAPISARRCMARRARRRATPARCVARVAAGSALGERLLAAMEPAWARPLAVGGVPYGFRHRDGVGASDTFYRVGDQAAVIPSFTGSGIAARAAFGAGGGGGDRRRDGRAALPRANGGGARARPMRWAGAAAWLLACGALSDAGGRCGEPVRRCWRSAARRTRIAGEA